MTCFSSEILFKIADKPKVGNKFTQTEEKDKLSGKYWK